MKFSIIIPVHNEERFIIEVLKRVNEQKKIFDIEIIVSNDGSTDETNKLLEENKSLYDILVNSETNLGKGSAIKNGLEKAQGDFTLIQDSDLEYNPNDYKNLFEPAINCKADVVYGSRFIGGSYVRLHFFWHFLANKILTIMSNIFTNLNMSDMETGYKLIKTDILKKIDIQEKSFGIEPELTLKLSKKKLKFYEVPISYEGRSYEEGKKIKFQDAFVAIYCIFKYGFFGK
jgi:glycosyltransferase involved in cell wall biosynthesis